MVFGGIRLNDGVTNQVTNATPGEFDIVTAWNTAQGVNYEARGLVFPDKANNKVTVTKPGIYLAMAVCSFSGSPNATIELHVYVNNLPRHELHCKEKLNAGGDTGTTSLVNYMNITKGPVDVDLRVASDGASDNFLLEEGWLTLIRIAAQ